MASSRILPVGSALRAASAARAASPRHSAPGDDQPVAPSPRGRRPGSSGGNISVDSAQLRPGSADSARRAMGGSPRIVMSPLHPRRGSRGDGSVGPPNRREQELREVCRQVAELAPQKFANVREAFRFLQPDHNGRVSRSQVNYFFRAYGVESVQAERLFGYFEPNENDDIDGHRFIAYFKQHINPDEPEGVEDDTDSRRPCTPGRREALNATATDRKCAKVANEFHYMLEEVREKAPQRFSHVREALRLVDGDYDGSITEGEMRHFFRAFGIEEARADKFFEKMAKGGPGGVNYHSFVQVVGPFLDLPGVVAATRPQSRPPSARSRPSSADRRPASKPRRTVSPSGGDCKEVLKSALSGTGDSCLPMLAQQGDEKASEGDQAVRCSSAGRTPAGPLCLPGCERARTPTSARGGRRTPREGSLAGSKQVSQQLSARGSGSRCASPLAQAPVIVPRDMLGPSTPESRHKQQQQAHQLALGNFKPQRLEEVFRPAPPPVSGRVGRRPVGIQREVGPAQKANDYTQPAQKQQAEFITVESREALMSGGRPVSTPMRRPSSGGRTRCESPSVQ